MSKVELVCLKDKSEQCPYKRKRANRKAFYNCVKPHTCKHPPCEWVIYEEIKK